METLCIVTGLLVLTLVPGCRAVERVFYIAAVEREWDYAPTGRNIINPQDQGTADKYLVNGRNRIGGVYTKTIYRSYTDATYRTEIPSPPWLGLYGPIIRGEIGDTITVHFRNNGSREFSMHPHGLFYKKDSESAIYMDGTSGRFKFDDIVMPGSDVTLTWQVHPDDAPGQDDPACIPYVYHSHIDTPPDTNTGLIGVISVCKPGTLNVKGERNDVDEEYFIVAKVFDENANWMTSRNLQKCGVPSECQRLLDDEDEEFMESNMMYTFNGYAFAQLPDLLACSGDKVAWHVIGMGNEIDIHTIEFHGQIVLTEQTSDDNIQVFPAVFKTGMMTVGAPGHWIIGCMVTDHFAGGMNAYFVVENCGARESPKLQGTIRNYYLAIEEEEWNYGPSGLDRFNGGKLIEPGSKAEPYFGQSTSAGRIGGQYKKARFQEYGDIAFLSRKSSNDTSLGILGPVLRAEAGDHINIVIKNKGSRPFSFTGHGLTYTQGPGEMTGHSAHVNPGTIHVYNQHVPDDVIGPNDPDCVVKIYYSAAISDVNSGLIGPLVLCRSGALDKVTGRQRYTAREFFLLFSAFDENKSWYLDDNIKSHVTTTVNKDNADFTESNVMHGINGLSFGNLDGLNMCVGDNVTWHILSYGSEVNVQAPYFHGNTFSIGNRHRDVGTLISGETHSLFMTPDNPGVWAVRSATNIMTDTGVTALYTVNPCGSTMTGADGVGSGVTRRYNIAVEEVDWDYAPRETSLINGVDLNDPRAAFIFVRDDENFIGDTYKKALYRLYTDNTFTNRKSRSQEDIHLGIMGPMIKAEVGDKIEVSLKNLGSREYSIHPHGLFYNKSNEGTAYNNGPDGGVQPGKTRVYTWYVPERAGPGSSDPNCIPWLYTSGIESTKDTYAGLIGTIVICRKGILDSNNTRTDVNREFALLFSIFNENKSWYLSDNIANHAAGRVGTDYDDDGDFEESNLFHSINGLLTGNNVGLNVRLNDTIAWYLLSSGSELDMHTIHFHGQTFTHVSNNKHRTDVIELYPGEAEEVEMRAHDVGTWILHCHVLDHISAGMETTYTVLP
ncbi:hephaestin-like protein [Haliotis rufescens]|uniref:hephaestin-like protein n=1 Tax=Haliotis rufescens TaxID=6454 RepID=UPI00201F5111|nr:hephaestin-like protein [Haliotis rufescens]